MIKQIVPIALLGATIFTLSACNSNGGFKKTANGLEYKIVRDKKEGASPKTGDVIEIFMKAKYLGENNKDTVMFDSWKMNNNKPMQFPLPPASFKGDIVEAFSLLTPGDSAVVRMSIDSLMKQPNFQLPPFMKKGHKIEYSIVMVSVKSQDQMKQEEEKHASAQMSTDDQILNDYFTKNNLHPQKTASGLYYIIEKPGSGPNARAGEAVTVNYTGRTLDGKVFDSNMDKSLGHAEPFTFTLGQGGVIKGWDEGVALLNKGAKAKLFIPSGMAYGPQSPAPAIPADAILMFDIEVLKIEAATAATANNPHAQPPVQ
jgi:FKBP-type peptidyl-prolyl cis-trans isomerase FkpA